MQEVVGNLVNNNAKTTISVKCNHEHVSFRVNVHVDISHKGLRLIGEMYCDANITSYGKFYNVDCDDADVKILLSNGMEVTNMQKFKTKIQDFGLSIPNFDEVYTELRKMADTAAEEVDIPFLEDYTNVCNLSSLQIKKKKLKHAIKTYNEGHNYINYRASGIFSENQSLEQLKAAYAEVDKK